MTFFRIRTVSRHQPPGETLAEYYHVGTMTPRRVHGNHAAVFVVVAEHAQQSAVRVYVELL